MAGFTDFIKDIFMIAPDKGLVGLTGIKPVTTTKSKKVIAKSKKSNPKLSDLMRKAHNQIGV